MELKGLSYSRLLDYQTGVLLTELGAGTPIRTIVGNLWNITLMWQKENQTNNESNNKR